MDYIKLYKNRKITALNLKKHVLKNVLKQAHISRQAEQRHRYCYDAAKLCISVTVYSLNADRTQFSAGSRSHLSKDL